MPRVTPYHLINTLPGGWPRRARSAAVQAVSLAQFVVTAALGWAALSLNPRLRLRAEIGQLQQEIHLLREEVRIKDARRHQIEAQKRPHYPPTARLAILELRAARNWSLAQTAWIFLVTPLTIASWAGRLDEEGPDALVRLPDLVNKFPDFVTYLVRRLKTLCPALGKVKIAQILARTGPRPRHFLSDQGSQFVARKFKRWCHRRGIHQRFGAIGQYGSLAVIDRCIRTLKNECTRRLILIPYRLAAMQQELAVYFSWYNRHRPHSRLRAATPDEIYHRRRPASRTPRFEPRPRWPRRSPRASAQALIRGQPEVSLHLGVRYHGGRRHLPMVTLKRAA